MTSWAMKHEGGIVRDLVGAPIADVRPAYFVAMIIDCPAASGSTR